jgi:hypothetical protein
MKSQNSMKHGELLKLITESTDSALAERLKTDSNLDEAQFRIKYATRLAAALAATLSEELEEEPEAIPKWE